MQSEIEFCDEGAILSAKEPLGDGLAHLTFQAPRIAKAARPGQFVMLYPSLRCAPVIRCWEGLWL